MAAQSQHECVREQNSEGASRESKTLDNDLRVTEHRSNVWLYCCASIWWTNDGRHIDLPGVTQPSIGPAAKKIQAAGFDVKHPCSVFPAAYSQLSASRFTSVTLVACSLSKQRVQCARHHVSSQVVINVSTLLDKLADTTSGMQSIA